MNLRGELRLRGILDQNDRTQYFEMLAEVCDSNVGGSATEVLPSFLSRLDDPTRRKLDD
jgi:hypothetical protein